MRSTHKRTIAVYVAVCCVVLLLGSLGAFRPIGERGAELIFFLGTGHVVELTEKPAETQPPQLSTRPTEGTTPTEEIPEESIPVETFPVREPLFSSSDAALVKLQNLCGYATDVPAWLCQPLSWQLQQTEPTVLILHSHGTESYSDTKSNNYRSKDRNNNMVSVGAELTRLLENAGIGVIHDTAMHDSPSYDDSYENSRASAEYYLQRYPSICLVLDLHRDSMMDSSGSQIRYALETEQGTAAKMMFVVGTDAGGQNHPKWSENMALAVKLQALLEKENPGICRPINFRTQRFNQDLSPGMMLVEMGSAGNSRQEALLAAQYLAKAIIALSSGTE